MKNAISLVVRAFVIATAVLVISSCSQPGPAVRVSKKLIPATIFLTPTGDNLAPCLAKVAPTRLQVKKNEDADWTIIDLCGGTKGYTIDVELRWPESNPTCDGLKSPLEGGQTNPTGKYSIKRGINPRCNDGDVFNYEVWLDGVKLVDPELEIA